LRTTALARIVQFSADAAVDVDRVLLRKLNVSDAVNVLRRIAGCMLSKKTL
jgi:hypothetical protein